MARVACLFLVLCCAASSADEIVLKDGTKIEWTSIKDLGDAYDVETAVGPRRVKKSDVSKIVPLVVEAPITGAIVSLEKIRKTETLDLLRAVDARNATGGTWSSGPGVLLSSAKEAMARLEFPLPLTDEYDLQVTVERRDGSGEIGFGLLGGGNRFLFAVDAFSCGWSGFAWIDGKSCNTNGHAVAGKLLEPKAPRTFLIQVRKDGVVAFLDGRVFMAYRGGWDRLSIDSALKVKGAATPFLAVYNGTFVFTQLKVIRPKP